MKVKNRKGFTLLEMIIAVGILSLMSVSILKVFLVSKDLNQKAYDLDNSVLTTKNIISFLDEGILPEVGNKTLDEKDYLGRMVSGPAPGEYWLYLDPTFSPMQEKEKAQAQYLWKMQLQNHEPSNGEGELLGGGLYQMEIQVQRLKPYIMKALGEQPIYQLSAKRVLFDQGGGK